MSTEQEQNNSAITIDDLFGDNERTAGEGGPRMLFGEMSLIFARSTGASAKARMLPGAPWETFRGSEKDVEYGNHVVADDGRMYKGFKYVQFVANGKNISCLMVVKQESKDGDEYSSVNLLSTERKVRYENRKKMLDGDGNTIPKFSAYLDELIPRLKSLIGADGLKLMANNPYADFAMSGSSIFVAIETGQADKDNGIEYHFKPLAVYPTKAEMIAARTHFYEVGELAGVDSGKDVVYPHPSTGWDNTTWLTTGLGSIKAGLAAGKDVNAIAAELAVPFSIVQANI